MPLSNEDILLIENFISGSLDAEELVQFESRRRDPEFEEEVQLYKQMSNASIEIERDGLKSTFEEWDKTSVQRKSGNTRILRLWPIAASALLLIGLGTLWFVSGKSVSSGQIFEQYYQPFDNLIDPISKNVEDKAPSTTQLYELGQYQNVVSNQVTDSLQAFYRTLALIELDRVEEAIPILLNYSEQTAFRFREAAQWYLALSYLKIKESAEAKVLLLEMSNRTGHDFQRLSREIVEEID